MSNVKVVDGNLFSSSAQTLVNTVNCVGVMGAGIAYECRLRYPEMYVRYVELCEKKLLVIGKLWLFKANDRWILNFPTKFDWKQPSKMEYIASGLRKFVETYEAKGITSVAFPVLGGLNGGLNNDEVIDVMHKFLSQCGIPIEIYRYNPTAHDEIFQLFCGFLRANDNKSISVATGVSTSIVAKIREAIDTGGYYQVNQLVRLKGVGDRTLEKIFSSFSSTGKESLL